MKKLLLVALIALSTSVSAEPASCEQMTELSGVIMQNRQAGLELADMLKIAGSGSGAKTFKAIVMTAYKKPQYSTDKYKAKAVVDFKNAMLMACLEAK